MDREQAKTSMEVVQEVAKAVADGATETAQCALSAVHQVSDGVTGFRAVVRKQPITMAFIMLALGYVIGSHLTQGRG